jgi:hypothetical protein
LWIGDAQPTAHIARLGGESESLRSDPGALLTWKHVMAHERFL